MSEVAAAADCGFVVDALTRSPQLQVVEQRRKRWRVWLGIAGAFRPAYAL